MNDNRAVNTPHAIREDIGGYQAIGLETINLENPLQSPVDLQIRIDEQETEIGVLLMKLRNKVIQDDVGVEHSQELPLHFRA